MVIVPRDEKDGAKYTRVPRRKGRVVAPRNERDGTERAWNNADEQEITVKKGKGNRESRVRCMKERKGNKMRACARGLTLSFVSPRMG